MPCLIPIMHFAIATVAVLQGKRANSLILSLNAYKSLMLVDEIRYTLSTTVLGCMNEFMGYITD